jgi:ABC-2 type transport system permease protein
LGLVYFVLGYLLFASLMAGTGILGDTAQESGQMAAVWTMTSMIPLFLMMSLGDAPNSVLARVLSFFPLTAPVTMLLRIAITRVPTADVLISIATLLLGVVVVVKSVAKIFRAASLMYGKRPGFSEIIHWLREA